MASKFVDMLKRARERFVETRRRMAEHIATKDDPANVSDAQAFSAIQAVMADIEKAITEEGRIAIEERSAIAERSATAIESTRKNGTMAKSVSKKPTRPSKKR